MGKLQHLTTYKKYHSFLQEDLKIASISDLHFSSSVKTFKLNAICHNLEQQKPDYILIVGDLLDSLTVMNNFDEKKRLENFLLELAFIAPVMISKGNHDFYHFSKKKNISDLKKESKKCFEEFAMLPNVYVLDDDVYEDSRIYVAGITQPPEYYRSKNRKGIVSFKMSEDREQLLKILENNCNLIQNLPKNKVCIAMIHSPIYLTDESVASKLNEFNYILAGHMHNGCVVPGLNEIWSSSYGIIAPNKTFFPKNARNILRQKEDKLIVNGALVTFQKCAGVMQIFNFLFPMETTLIECVNDKKYDTEKVYQRREYFRILK